MIPQETINRIKETAEIIEVISDFVQLKKSGSSYKGLSPFVDEKTPSFMVSPQKGIFKDFASGKAGDSITFVMEHEGMSYIEALKYLAEKYGIEIVENFSEEQKQEKTERESLYIALNFAKDFYKDYLHNTSTGKAVGLSYFKERGFLPGTLEKFDLGFSPDAWDALLKEATKKQYSKEVLEKAGLITIKEGGKTYDRFRNRVMFPIHNVSGKVIAFGARILVNDKKQPKYLNSPETPVYHKSDILYGIYQAKNAIRNNENCYLVEGYTDVISLHQAQVENVVASSGTALTVEQIKLIKRYSPNVTVLYDGDDAGIRASIRGIDLILEQGLNVKVVLFPDGHDPDSYAREVGASAFQEHIQKEAVDFLTFKTKYFLKEVENDPVKKAEIIGEIVESISKIPDAIKQAVFFTECSKLLGVDEDVLKQAAQERKEKNKPKPKPQGRGFSKNPTTPTPPPSSFSPGPPDEDFPDPTFFMPEEEMEQATVAPKFLELQSQEKEIVRLLLNYGHEQIAENLYVVQFILREIQDVTFQNEGYQAVVQEFRDALDKDEVLTSTHFLNHENEDLIKVAVNLLDEKYELSDWENIGIYPKKEFEMLEKVSHSTIIRLKWFNVKKMLKEIQQDLQNAKSEEESMEILNKYKLLKQVEVTIAQELGNVTTG